MENINIFKPYKGLDGRKWIDVDIILPRYVQTAKNKKGAKKYYINLNNYNTRKFHQYNNIKKAFRSFSIFQDFKEFLQSEGISILYIDDMEYSVTIGKKLKKFDRGNVVSMFRKMFEDALVDNGIIEDDNDSFIR